MMIRRSVTPPARGIDPGGLVIFIHQRFQIGEMPAALPKRRRRRPAVFAQGVQPFESRGPGLLTGLCV